MAMALVTWMAMCGLAGLLPVGKLGELILLAVGAMTGVVVYFGAAVLLRIPEARMVTDIAKRILKRGG